MRVIWRKRGTTMSRRRYRKGKQSRLGEFFVCMVVAFLIVIVFVRCIDLQAKNREYTERQEELQAQIQEQELQAEKLEELRKYVQTDSYVEEVAEEKLGLVREGEIIFKTQQ